MSHQCPFPVRATDTRRCYRTGSVPGFTLSLTLVAILSGYAGLADAAPAVKEIPAPTETFAGPKAACWQRRVPACRTRNFAKAMKQVNAKSKGRFTQNNIHVIELPPGLDEVKASNHEEEQGVEVRRTRHGGDAGGHVSDPVYSKQLGSAQDPGSDRMGHG
jgi:hypothetical protein